MSIYAGWDVSAKTTHIFVVDVDCKVLRHDVVASDSDAPAKSRCAYLGSISAATYNSWLAKDMIPWPVSGTTRYDVRQHDHVRLTGFAGQT